MGTNMDAEQVATGTRVKFITYVPSDTSASSEDEPDFRPGDLATVLCHLHGEWHSVCREVPEDILLITGHGKTWAVPAGDYDDDDEMYAADRIETFAVKRDEFITLPNQTTTDDDNPTAG